MLKLQVELISKMAPWVRDTEVGQMRLGDLPKEHHDSFNSTIGRANGIFRINGEDKWIMHWTNPDQGRIAVRGLSSAEHKLLDNDFTRRAIYEKELPKGFHNKQEYWPVGSWHG